MRKIICVLIIVSCIINGCGGDAEKTDVKQSSEDISGLSSVLNDLTEKTVEKGLQISVIKADCEGLEYELINNSSNNYVYGKDFKILRLDNYYNEPEHVVLPENREFSFSATGYSLSPGDKINDKIKWNNLYGTLESGTWIFCKSIQLIEGENDMVTEMFDIGTSFEIE